MNVLNFIRQLLYFHYKKATIEVAFFFRITLLKFSQFINSSPSLCCFRAVSLQITTLESCCTAIL